MTAAPRHRKHAWERPLRTPVAMSGLQPGHHQAHEVPVAVAEDVLRDVGGLAGGERGAGGSPRR